MTAREHAIVAGVVLAAGAGRRFGGPKALVRFEGKLLVERAIATLLDGGCERVVVVLGANAASVREQAHLGDAKIVVNEQWPDGMSTSLRVGLAACAEASGAVVALVDQPGVTSLGVRRLIASWRSSGLPVAAASYGGAVRNPVLFGAPVWSDVVAAVRGDEGARGWLRANTDIVLPVEMADVASAFDIDTPADLAASQDAN